MDEITTISKERKLLRKLIKESNSSMSPITFEQLNITSTNYYAKLLKQHHLVQFTDTDMWDNNPKSIMLTEAGLHFFTFKHEQVKGFIVRSIFTPIVVSAVTTLITIFIRSLIEK